jgi:hypothetical protein
MTFVQDLNERHFDGKLSADVMLLLEPINDERDDVKVFVERVLRLASLQRIAATDFSEFLAWILVNIVPQMLPGGWGGLVPPITVQGRHAALDEYAAANPWRALVDGDRFLDLGCGFPPLTAIDSAKRFPNVSFTAADPSFGRYIVREPNDDYASFNAEAKLLYWQAGSPEAGRWEALYADPQATEARLVGHLSAALEELPEDRAAHGSVERNGVTVTQNPVADFERDNLSFVEQGIGSDGLQGFQTVRCMNVLIYFDRPFRDAALEWLADVLVDGGLFFVGMNWTKSRAARYTVYQSEGGVLVAKEFAFSIENIRSVHLVPWYILHDDDYDSAALTELIRTLRDDDDFRTRYDTRLDELLAEIGFCARRDNGYLGGMPDDADPALFETATDTIGSGLERDGFPEDAVAVLKRAGYDAWVNSVGHIAVDPKGLSV